MPEPRLETQNKDALTQMSGGSIGRGKAGGSSLRMPTNAQSITRILLVEDEPKLRASLAEGLATEDWSVISAATASEAQQHLSSEHFDALVLDWMLPDGDGLEILRRLRANGNSVPALVISARGGASAETMVRQAGASDYLAKPFSFDDLLAHTRALLAPST